MDPTLLLCMALAYFLRNAAVDTAYAVRGESNPRYELKKQKLHARTESSTSSRREPYRSDHHGAARFFSERWHDAWEDADAFVKHRREKKAAKRAEREQPSGRPEQGDLGEQPRGGINTPDAPAVNGMQTEEEAEEPTQSDHDPTIPDSGTKQGNQAGDPSVESEKPTSDSPVDSEMHPESHQDSPSESNRSAGQEKPNTTTQGGVFVSVPTQNANGNGTTQSGETVSLDAAINFAQGMATGARDGVTKSEQSMAGLQAAEVGPSVLSRLAQAQELLANVAAEYDAVAAELEKQRGAQEAYRANPDTGSKQFLLQE